MTTNKLKITKNYFKPNQITTIFFDLDNTLIPTRKGDSKTCNKMTDYLHEKYGISRDVSTISTSSFLKAFRKCPDNPQHSLDAWRCHLWEDSLPDLYKIYAPDIYKMWLSLRYRYVNLSQEFQNFLLTLRQHYLIGLITNGPSNAQWEKINRLNLSKIFDCILVSADLPWEKPDSRIFLAACNYLGVDTKQCIMVGDKLETDIQGGIEANLGATIWIPLTNERPESDVGPYPDFILTNLLEIQNLLPETTIPKSKAFRSRSFGSSNGGMLRNRRVSSLPELDSSNSNSSDGS